MYTTSKALFLSFIFATALGLVGGCDAHDGKAERMGEKIDESLEKTGDSVSNAADDVKDGIQEACKEVAGKKC